MLFRRKKRFGYTANAGQRTVTPVPQWVKELVPKPEGKNETIKSGSEDVERDTMPLIKSKIYRTLYHTKKLAPKLKGKSLRQTLQNDWNFIFDHIKYVQDEPGEEQVRSPRRLIWEGRGDCDCFTVTLSSLLLNQKIPHYLRIMKETENDENDNWTHIYIIVPKSGQLKKPKSRDDYYVLDCVTHAFDFEAPNIKTKDYPMGLQYLDGLSGENSNCSKSRPLIKRLRHFAYTDQIVTAGLVPTKQFLEQNQIDFETQIDSNTDATKIIVATPDGMKSVPTVLTKDQAATLLKSFSRPVAVVPTGTPTVNSVATLPDQPIQQAQASAPMKNKNLLWYLLAGALVAAAVFTSDDKSPDNNKLNGLSKSPPRRKKLNSPVKLRL